MARIRGNGRDNILIGTSDEDTINGGQGADTMSGGDGNDTYYVDNLGDLVVERPGEGANDLIYTTLDNYTLGKHIDNLIFTEPGNHVGTGNALDNFLYGNDGDDWLKGLSGDDYLNGDDGADTLEGGSGNDSLAGGWGGDYMRGGAGSDWYHVDNVLDVVDEFDEAGSQDTVNSYIDYTLGSLLENLTLGLDFDIDGTGNAKDNRLEGSLGNNRLYGLDGNDTLFGGEGGNDTLEGGMGADSFELTSDPFHTDTITDFKHEEDVMVLRQTGLEQGPIEATQFHSGPGAIAESADQRVIFDTDTGNLYFDPDGNGVREQFVFAVLSGTSDTPDYSDFTIA